MQHVRIGNVVSYGYEDNRQLLDVYEDNRQLLDGYKDSIQLLDGYEDNIELLDGCEDNRQLLVSMRTIDSYWMGGGQYTVIGGYEDNI
jgi:hypothetical protein